jgi:hypothetical protein
MLSELTALKTAYEEEQMTVEEIAESRELDLSAVKAGLMQCSAKYRRACGKEEEETDSLNFSREEQQRIKDALYDLALSTEDEHLRFKALVYCRDDAKGRKDVVKDMKGANFNILMINERMKQVRQITDKLKRVDD